MANPTNAPAAGVDLPLEYFVSQHKKPDPPADPAAPPEPTQDQLDAELKTLSAAVPNLLWGDEPPKPVDPPKPVEPPKPPAAKPVEPPKPADPPADPADEPDEPPAPTVKRVSKAGLSATDLAADIAARTGQAVREALQPITSAPASAAPDPDAAFVASLSPDDQELLDGLKTAEMEFPEKYKGIYQKQVQFVRQLDDYRRRWEQAHPNEEWNPEDDAHSAIFKRQPDIPTRDIDRARYRQEAKAVMSEREKTYQVELEQVRQEATAAKIQPEVRQRAQEATGEFIAQLDESIQKTIKEKGVDGLKEADPDTYAILDAAATEVQQLTMELHTLVAGAKRFDPANPVHAHLSQRVSEFEQAMMSLPANKRARDGKQFTTRERYDALPADQKSRHWVLGPEDVVQMLTRSAAAQAKAKIAEEDARFERRAKARGLAASASVSAAPAAPPPPGGDGGLAPPTTSKAGQAAQTIEEQLKKSLWA
jgi:hypothetical protein